jgi:error-prone DNA polymerase
VAAPGQAVRGGTQLALPVDPHDAPPLRELTPWERMLADYGSTKVTLHEHPLELMRESLGERYETSELLATGRSGRRVRVAGLVVARQRPATAKGVTFMLLEDELGAINLIVPPPVYEDCRAVVRAEPLVWATGRLERREGVTNVVVDDIGRLERPDLPLGEVRHIEPKVRWSNERAAAAMSTDDLRAVVPAGHSFGRRG